jgi:hypothetical protein
MKSNSGFRLLSILSLSIIVLVSFGCATRINQMDPTEVVVYSEHLPPLTIKNSVTLINNQPSTDPVLLATTGFDEYYGNLNLWTEGAIDGLTQAIKHRGGDVVPDAKKTLKISVTDATLDYGENTWHWHAKVWVEVITGSGLKKEFTAYQIAGVALFEMHNNVVAYAVIEILKDKDIINYLNEA